MTTRTSPDFKGHTLVIRDYGLTSVTYAIERLRDEAPLATYTDHAEAMAHMMRIAGAELEVA